jgi:hypothetical protein
MDYGMYKKAVELLRTKQYAKLGKHIYDAETAPREYVMGVLDKKEPSTFKKIFGNQTGYYSLMKPKLKEEIELEEQTLRQKAVEIAKKMEGNYTGAVKEIEKLMKGLSKDPVVATTLKRVNENLEEKIKPFMISYSKQGKHAGFEDADTLPELQKKAASLRSKGFTIDKMGRYNPPVKEENEKEMPMEPKKEKDKKAEEENKDTQIRRLIDQIAILKTKLENEKNKAVKPEPNPDTGEVPLTVGVAYKHFKDKKEKEVKEETISERGGANTSSKQGSFAKSRKPKYRFGYRVAEKQPKGDDIEEATVVSDISGISIPALKRETAKFNIKVARVTPGGPMGAEYEVTFTGAEKDLIAYAKEHFGFDDKPGTFQQLKKHLNMDYVPEKAMTDKEKRLQRAKDMIKYYDAQKKAALKGKNKELAKKMLKNDIEEIFMPTMLRYIMTKPDGKGNFNLMFKGKEIGYYHKEGGRYVVYHSYDKRDKEYTQSDMVNTPTQAKKMAYDNMTEADLSKKQIKMVHKVADDLPKKDFKDRYGKEKGDAVRFGTATNMVKKKLGMKEDRRLYVETIAGLKKKAEKSGMPYGILKKVYDRGMAAWKSGHRPGASQQQWAFARVNSFVTKSSGTWGGADKDLAKQVRGSK